MLRGGDQARRPSGTGHGCCCVRGRALAACGAQQTRTSARDSRATSSRHSGQLAGAAPVQDPAAAQTRAPHMALRVASWVGTACTNPSGAPRRLPPYPVWYGRERSGPCPGPARPEVGATGRGRSAGVRRAEADVVVVLGGAGGAGLVCGEGRTPIASPGPERTRSGRGGSGGGGNLWCSQASRGDIPRKLRVTPTSWAARAAACSASSPLRSQNSKAPSSTTTDGGCTGSLSMSSARSCPAVCRSASPRTTRTCCSAARSAMTISPEGLPAAAGATESLVQVALRG